MPFNRAAAIRYLPVMLELIFKFRKILNNSLSLLPFGSFRRLRDCLMHIIDSPSLPRQLRS
jgi:hypothetical protein